MTFYVGQKVVCIIDRPWGNKHNEITPVRDRIYTVRDIGIWNEAGLAIKLYEIVNQPFHYTDGFREMSFMVKYFRPLTDIGIFHEILAKVNNKSKVDA